VGNTTNAHDCLLDEMKSGTLPLINYAS